MSITLNYLFTSCLCRAFILKNPFTLITLSRYYTLWDNFFNPRWTEKCAAKSFVPTRQVLA